MKRLCTLILAILVLCGCGPVSRQGTFSVRQPELPVLREALPTLGKPRELMEEGSLVAWTLGICAAYSLLAWEEELLLLEQQDGESRLLLLKGNTLQTAAQARLPEISSARLQLSPNHLSYFDPQARQLVVLDRELQETARHPAPEGLTGDPLLSAEGDRIYFCADGQLQVLELASGICRSLNTGLPEGTSLLRELLPGEVLEAQYQDSYWGSRKLYLSARTGEALADRPQVQQTAAAEDWYCASFPNGSADSLVFGSAKGEPQALYPRSPQAAGSFLPRNRAAVTLEPSQNQSQVRLDYYDLVSGRRTGEITLPSSGMPRQLCSLGDSRVFFLMQDPDSDWKLLCLWDTAKSPCLDNTIYIGPHYTPEAPDEGGLLACREQALALEQVYGIHISLWKEARNPGGSGYALEEEYRTDLIRPALNRLESWLRRFPPGFWEGLNSGLDSLTLCLVRSIETQPSSGISEPLSGVTLWSGRDCRLVLALGEEWEGAFYRQLGYAIDAFVLSRSGAWDSWNRLNPKDFSYGTSPRDQEPWLREESRAFVDEASMAYPQEDRARIWELALMPGQEQLFQAPILQRKLLTICNGLREAFSMEDCTDPLPWEQYLLTPWTPVG